MTYIDGISALTAAGPHRILTCFPLGSPTGAGENINTMSLYGTMISIIHTNVNENRRNMGPKMCDRRGWIKSFNWSELLAGRIAQTGVAHLSRRADSPRLSNTGPACLANPAAPFGRVT